MISIPNITWQRSLFFLICVALFASAQVGLSFMRNTLSSDVQKQENKQRQLTQDISHLKLELASLKRPERLRKLAREQLGMVSPQAHQVIRP